MKFMIYRDTALFCAMTAVLVFSGVARSQALEIGEFQAFAKQVDDKLIKGMISEYMAKTSQRAWKSKSGDHTITAKYIGSDIGEGLVFLSSKDDEKKEVQISALSDKDRAHLKRIVEIEAQLPTVSMKRSLELVESLTKEKLDFKVSFDSANTELSQLRKELEIARRFMPSTKIANGNETPEVTSARLETFGSEYVNKRVRFTNARWGSVSDTWVDSLPLADRKSFIGFSCLDSKGEIFQYAFTRKSEWGDFLLNLGRNDRINFSGTVVEFGENGWHGVLIDSIEKVEPEKK
jgi:hypothetical protein